ncbi:DUF6460 domain-containing protein [Aquisalinus flavus]|uniref:DUF6460 domain-containing protein n=1 Tax=Aquisalinus flavus TaxID=1526572 RepID=A0A8J2V4L0_9PROT|nr:DUF6460 domain-containing protein [Aquisalinus flavus]MBD0426181.1 integrase [Aquisalinus flavus]UNE48244.1 integrase [Aquisalinus flavus]GGD09933.1 hypothetical protein GCM10011342_18570 [Aquisalinus flavus]
MSDSDKQTGAASRKSSARRSYGSIIRTVLFLVLASFLAGVLLDLIGMAPLEFWRGIVDGVRDFFAALFSIGWGTISLILNYVIFGALIVVPVWLVVFLLNRRKK